MSESKKDSNLRIVRYDKKTELIKRMDNLEIDLGFTYLGEFNTEEEIFEELRVFGIDKEKAIKMSHNEYYAGGLKVFDYNSILSVLVLIDD